MKVIASVHAADAADTSPLENALSTQKSSPHLFFLSFFGRILIYFVLDSCEQPHNSFRSQHDNSSAFLSFQPQMNNFIEETLFQIIAFINSFCCKKTSLDFSYYTNLILVFLLCVFIPFFSYWILSFYAFEDFFPLKSVRSILNWKIDISFISEMIKKCNCIIKLQ